MIYKITFSFMGHELAHLKKDMRTAQVNLQRICALGGGGQF
jgi:hypothetical protein